MALRLSINGRQVDLRQGQTIEQKLLNDIFNLDYVEATVTLPFSLDDTPNNRSIFGFIDLPSSLKEIEAEYPALLELDGLIYKEAVFVLDRIRQGFEGYLKADAGVFSDVKDLPIGGFVDHVVEVPPVLDEFVPGSYTFLLTDTFAQFFDGRFDALDSPVCFPLCVHSSVDGPGIFSNPESARKPGDSLLCNNPALPLYTQVGELYSVLETQLVPFVKFKLILQKLIESKGYTPIFETSSYYLFEQACMISVKGSTTYGTLPDVYNLEPINLGYSFNLKDGFLPDIKVADFLGSVRKMGIHLSFNSRTKVCRIVPFKEILNSTQSVEMTYAFVPDVEIERLDPSQEAVSFSFALKQDAEEPEFIASVIKEADLPPAEEQAGKFSLVKNLNAYHQAEVYTQQPANEIGLAQAWRANFAPTFEQEQLNFERDVASQFVPCPNATKFWRNIGDCVVSNIGGKPKVLGDFVTGLLGIGVSQTDPGFLYMRILDEEAYGDSLHAHEPDGFEWRLATLDYVPGIGNVEAEIIYDFDGKNLPWVQEQLAGKPLITLWHGVQEGYRFASSGNYSPSGTVQLCHAAVRWEEPDGIIAQHFQEFIAASRTRKLFVFDLLLKLKDVVQFEPLTKILVDSVKYLVISFRAKFTNRGRNERVKVEVEARRV